MAAHEIRNVAVGFLYHSASGKVLLQLRDVDKPPNAGKWAFFGGRYEPEDGGDLLTTWCREMREELGVTLDPARVISLRHGTYDNGLRWHDFYYEWPSREDDFALTEGQRLVLRGTPPPYWGPGTCTAHEGVVGRQPQRLAHRRRSQDDRGAALAP